jgi:sugar phosphate isomerase/epimerase
MAAAYDTTHDLYWDDAEVGASCTRTAEKATALAAAFAGRGRVTGCGLGDLAGERFDVVLNATSASLKAELPAVPVSVFAGAALAYELVYGKGLTPFLRLAQNAGGATAGRWRRDAGRAGGRGVRVVARCAPGHGARHCADDRAAGLNRVPTMPAPAQVAPTMPAFGWCGTLDKAADIHAAGLDYLELQLVPLRLEDDTAFADAKARVRDLPLPSPVMSYLFPHDLRLVGPIVQEDRARAYVDRVVELMSVAGAGHVVYGSGWTRNIPEGFDTAQAQDEEAEPLALLAECGGALVHVHLADTDRLNPGTGRYDYPAFFGALKRAGYAGRFSAECGVRGAPVAGMRFSAEFLRRTWAQAR